MSSMTSSDPDLSRHALLGLLHAVAGRLHATLPHDDAEAAVRDALRSHPATTPWPTVWKDAAARLGWRVRLLDASLDGVAEEAARAAGPVVLVGESAGVWRVVAGRRQVRVASTGWAPSEPGRWWLVERARSADAMRDAHHPAPWRRLLAWLRAEAPELRYLVVYAVGVTLLGLATPVAVQVLVNTLAIGATAQSVGFLVALLALCLSLAGALALMQRYLTELVQRRLFVRLFQDLADRIPAASSERLGWRAGGAFIHRFVDGVMIQKALSSLLIDGIDAVVAALVAMVLLAAYAPVLLGFDLMLVVGVAAVVLAGRGAVPSAVAESKARDRVLAAVGGFAGEPHWHAVAGAPALAAQRAESLASDWLDARTAHYRIAFRQQALAVVLHVVAQGGILAIGASLVRDGALTLGQLVAAEVVVTSVVVQALKLANKVETFYDLLAAVDKIGHMVDVPVPLALPSAAAPVGSPGVEVQWTVGERSLTCAAGGRVVVFDPEGAAALGATVRGGEVPGRAVRLDGRPRGAWTSSARGEVVAVIEDFGVFSGTVRDNLLLARVDAGDAEAWDALRRFALVEAVGASGLDAHVDGQGRVWTRGERVRLQLARAWVAGVRGVVLDGVLDGLSAEEASRVWNAASEAGAWTLFAVGRRTLHVEAAVSRWALVGDRLGEEGA
jgi:putative ABC transport system ATP-binding protein